MLRPVPLSLYCQGVGAHGWRTTAGRDRVCHDRRREESLLDHPDETVSLCGRISVVLLPILGPHNSFLSLPRIPITPVPSPSRHAYQPSSSLLFHPSIHLHMKQFLVSLPHFGGIPPHLFHPLAQPTLLTSRSITSKTYSSTSPSIPYSSATRPTPAVS